VGHARHFLERLSERVDAEAHESELALSLYRDRGLVTHILQVARLPGERIAISLGDEQGPFVVVTRDGNFVTCLGRGMNVGQLEVLPRERLDAITEQLGTFRERQKRAAATTGKDGVLDVIRATTAKEDTLAREDVAALVAIAPIIGGVLASSFAKHCDSLYTTRFTLPTEKIRSRVDVMHVKAYWGLLFAQANLAIVVAAADRHVLDDIGQAFEKHGVSPTIRMYEGGILGIAARAMWFAARFARPVMPLYERKLESAEDRMDFVDAACSLWAMGVRHARLGSRITSDLPMPDPRPELQEQMLVEAGEETLRRIARMAEDAPYRSITRLEDVPVDLAKTTLLQSLDDTLDPAQGTRLLGILPIAARAEAVDFFYPEAFARALGTQYTQQRSLELASRMRFLHVKHAPVVAEARPGRNDPCSCGSGKKWKRCHGAS
jgi:hypothetical protein